MLTFYCPNCWKTIKEGEKVCPHCGYLLDQFNEEEFEDKLLQALYHSVPERRIMAAQILGNRGSQRAIREFLKIVSGNEMDYFFLRAVLLAAIKIDHPDRANILKMAKNHPSKLVSNFANELMSKYSDEGKVDLWDGHVG